MWMPTAGDATDRSLREQQVKRRRARVPGAAGTSEEVGIRDLAVALKVESWLATREARDALAVLRDAGCTGDAAAAIEWLPALEVGWLGGLCDAERHRVLVLADERAVGREGRAQIAQWCHAAPGRGVLAAGRSVLRNRVAALPPPEALATLDRVLDACDAVADAAGWFGLWRVSARERALRDAIRADLASGRGSPSHPLDGGMTPGDGLSTRVLAEYREMPGLSLTAAQAARLWSIDGNNCENLLQALVDQNRLRRTADGRYRARDDRAGSRRLPPRRLT